MHVEFWFDFSCPYAFLASEVIEGICSRAGATLSWHPMLLGGVFRAIGEGEGPMTRLSPAKALHTTRDALRWADQRGIGLQFPAGHPIRTVRALRVLLALPPAHWPAAIHALYRAYWQAEGRERRLDRDEVIEAALAAAAIPADVRAAAFAAADTPAIKDELRARTDDAVGRGVFGAPTCFVTVDGRAPVMLWGQDRLHWVEAVLGGWRPDDDDGPPPPATTAVELGAAAPGAGAAPVVDFYFDLSSPFAYLGSTQIERVCAEAGATLRWKPLLLGGLFKAIGTVDVPLFAMSDAKRRHLAGDMGRWARWWGVPFRMASRFPMRTVTALRMILAAGDQATALTHRLFRAGWAEDLDLADEPTLRRLAADAGCADDLVERTRDPAIKQALIAATAEAQAAGVFGVPTCVIHRPGRAGDGDATPALLWGQDRLDLVAALLRA
ncbi:MAG: DsbA family protein [Kofleriaceae bacterium]|nr:DsbA family protein [Kofleriaceae bacterium]